MCKRAYLVKIVIELWAKFVDDVNDLIGKSHPDSLQFVKVTLMSRTKGKNKWSERPTKWTLIISEERAKSTLL